MAQATEPRIGTQQMVSIGELIPSGTNPRSTFDQGKLNELADDIALNGILQPLLVRPVLQAGQAPRYQVVAGSRRLRAAELVKLKLVPVYILPVETDADALALAISENVNREDLNPMELAAGYDQLQKLRGMTQAEIGKAVGKSQEVISNTGRLLKLPELTQGLLRDGLLTTSHGTSILRFDGFPDVMNAIAHEAAETHVAVAELDRAPVPFPAKLAKANVIKEVASTLPFASICQKKCPFRAYVKSAPNSDFGYCLNPAHFAELTAEAEAKAKEEQARLKTAAQIPETKGKNPKRGLPMLQNLDPSTYQRIVDDAEPTGCTVDCPCRGRALLSDGATEAAICLDRKRFEKLRRADQRKYDMTVAHTKTAYFRQLEVRLGGPIEAGAAELIVMLARCDWRSGAGEHVLARRGLLDLIPADYYHAGTDVDRLRYLLLGLTTIADKVGVQELARIGAEYIVRMELESTQTLDLPLTSWLLGPAQITTTEAATDADSDPEEEDDAEATAGGEGAPEALTPSDVTDTSVSADPESEIPGTVEETDEDADAREALEALRREDGELEPGDPAGIGPVTRGTPGRQIDPDEIPVDRSEEVPA
jgi:ParB/RepB/Spo0J family partition protein